MTATETKVTNWTIDPAHSIAEFAVRHMMISTVRGHFSDVSGTITFDPNNPANSLVHAEINAASVDTGQDQRDDHLRSADFFEVEKYPKIVFDSTKFEKVGDDRYKIVGNLTIRDVTREVELDARFLGQILDAFGKQRIGVEATTTINREDFGLTWNQVLEAGGVMVSDTINITLNIAATADED